MAGSVRLLGQRARIADHPWQEAHHRLDHDHCRDLPATQHVIANAQLVDPHPAGRMFDDAGVDALVSTASEDQVPFRGQLVREGLSKGPARR